MELRREMKILKDKMNRKGNHLLAVSSTLARVRATTTGKHVDHLHRLVLAYQAIASQAQQLQGQLNLRAWCDGAGWVERANLQMRLWELKEAVKELEEEKAKLGADMRQQRQESETAQAEAASALEDIKGELQEQQRLTVEAETREGELHNELQKLQASSKELNAQLTELADVLVSRAWESEGERSMDGVVQQVPTLRCKCSGLTPSLSLCLTVVM